MATRLKLSNMRVGLFNYRHIPGSKFFSQFPRTSNPRAMMQFARSSIRPRFSVTVRQRMNIRAVERRMDRYQWRSMRRAGALVRKIAVRSMRRPKAGSLITRIIKRRKSGKPVNPAWVHKQYQYAVSKPGEPPKAFAKGKSGLKRIEYAIDTSSRTAKMLCGLYRYNKPGFATKHMEWGGTVKVRSIKHRDRERKRGPRPIYVKPRPVMKLAYAKAIKSPQWSEVLKKDAL